MKYILIILFGLSAFLANASHLAGGELTYKYISGKTYQINVTLYRDCNDCKLGGTGGGTSTTNCTDLDEVYIRTINSNCENKTIGSISLSKTGIENITPICNTARSKCETNPDFPYGYEAHYYSGTVNFNDYNSYNGCMFQIFFHKSERSENITNLTSDEDDLYNFALLNPWIENTSSPTFSQAPKLLFNLYQPSYSTDGVIGNSGDSLAFNWGVPYSNYNSAIAYKSGFNAYNFTTTYCPAGGTCNANPNANLPEGLYLNQTTGDFVFTPVGNSETSTRVLEVEQWRKINGSYQLAGKIRRDVIVLIAESIENNPPVIDINDTYYMCVGQKFELPITITDAPYNANGTLQKQDTVNTNIITNLSGLVVQKSTSSLAPYIKTTISYEPKTGDEGTYYVQINAIDNFCPQFGSTFKTIKLVIRSKPDFSYHIEDLFCGTNSIKLTPDRSGQFDINIKNKDNSIIFNKTNSTGKEVFKHTAYEELNVQISFTDAVGCVLSKNYTYQNKGISEIEKASISGSKKVCENSQLELKLEHNNLDISEAIWSKLNKQLANTTDLKTTPFNGSLTVNYTLLKDRYTCLISDSVTIELLQITPIELDQPQPFCYQPTFNLQSLNPSPSNGLWVSSQPITENKVTLSSLGNRDSFFTIQYSFTNIQGCTNIKSFDIPILRMPLIELSNEAICGDKYEFRLNNAIELPYNPDVEQITWRVLNKPEALITLPFAVIDIPTYGTGIYSIEATNTYSNGCIARDTGIISVDEGLQLRTNGKNYLCQQGEAINLDNYLELNATGGGWNSFAAGDLLNQRLFTPSICGDYDFLYTYDKNGCFDEIQLNLNVVCKPQFDYSISQAICEDYQTIELPTKGTWIGPGVINNHFNPTNLEGWINLRNIVKVGECTFDTFVDINILEQLQLEIGELPRKLCQGEVLSFQLQSTDESLIKIESCTNVASIENGQITYNPASCDLINNAIKLKITQESDGLCNYIVRNVDIPYYKLPQVEMPSPYKACWPYSVNHTIETSGQSITEISHKISSNTRTYENNSNIISYNFPNYGNYALEINTTNEHGCKNSQVFDNQYIIHPKPTASFTAGNKKELSLSERDVYFDNKSSIVNGSLTFNWYWTKNKESEHFSQYRNPYYKFPADTGKFEINLVAISDNNCNDTASENIWIVPDILVFIPNAFTPDNRGPIENATFKVISSNVQSFHIQIFNKWGQMMFESFDITHSWDGNYQDKPCQTGLYVYSIKLTNQSGLEYQYQGAVNLVR